MLIDYGSPQHHGLGCPECARLIAALQLAEQENARLKASAREVAELNNPTMLAQMDQAVRVAKLEAALHQMTAERDQLQAQAIETHERYLRILAAVSAQRKRAEQAEADRAALQTELRQLAVDWRSQGYDAAQFANELRAVLARHPQERPWNLQHELRTYLDGLMITGENIGDIRRSLFVPWTSAWNRIVRDETASRERSAPVPEPTREPSCHGCGGPIEIGKPVAIYHEKCDPLPVSVMEAHAQTVAMFGSTMAQQAADYMVECLVPSPERA